MISELEPGRFVNVDIDKLYVDYEKAKEFVEYLEKVLK